MGLIEKKNLSTSSNNNQLKRMAVIPQKPIPNSDMNDVSSSNIPPTTIQNSPNRIIEEEDGMSSRPFSGVSIDIEATQPYVFGVLDESRYFNYVPSTESLLAKLENRKHLRSNSQSSLSNSQSWSSNLAPNYSGHFTPTNGGINQNGFKYEPMLEFASWSSGIPPLSVEEIEDIIRELGNVFGFQQMNQQNIIQSLLTMLDSRASRMPHGVAISGLHFDYIGGKHANYMKWIFSTRLYHDGYLSVEIPDQELNKKEYFGKIKSSWRKKNDKSSLKNKVTQVALYLLIWGEASSLRFVPECLAFIFKLSLDYYYLNANIEHQPEFHFLNEIVKPLYGFVRNQGYELVAGKYRKREKDHCDIVGYDDINEFFWFQASINKMICQNGEKMLSLAPERRYVELWGYDWKKVFRKTYKERRTPLHLLTNFTRIWIFHITLFYFYLVANADFLYTSNSDDEETINVPLRLVYIGLGGLVPCFISIASTFMEFFFISNNFRRFWCLTLRILILTFLAALNIIPFLYVYKVNSTNTIAMTLAIVHIVIAILTTLILTIVPSNSLFFGPAKPEDEGASNSLTNNTFTSNFPKLHYKDRIISVLLWSLILVSKMWESYFYLALSFKDVFKNMIKITIPQCFDPILGSKFCHWMPYITLSIMTLLDLVLFFLDTYFWYIVWNSIFSVIQSFYVGISILTPWRNVFSRLPKRIHAKILASAELKMKAKVLVSQVWNSIVISMYRDHLISIDHLQRLLYQYSIVEETGEPQLKPPTFFVAQEDKTLKAEFFPNNSEAERRISFFAQSLSTILPSPVSVDQMPSFTVFTPHFAEKVLLSLREIIREEDCNSRVTLLEYLKSLHSVEWDYFVKDTKVLAEESHIYTPEDPLRLSKLREDDEKSSCDKNRLDDVPMYAIGFKSASPEYILRTRIWASLRAQTLYRTVSGFMNYHKAIKILYRVENLELVKMLSPQLLELELDKIASRKFKMLISMQRLEHFTPEEVEDVEFLLKVYPQLQIAYLQEIVIKENDSTDEVMIQAKDCSKLIKKENRAYYACLIDGHCPKDENGRRLPKFKVKLPGHPILGDGKADNQNLGVIFSRGEYVQLIDANQDNYLEETLKIRNLLSEFEQYQEDPTISPYSSQHPYYHDQGPVAIVGAREYIFSENVGVLGDVAAAKEQTFGTLTHRIMAKVGGRLHYGHPDFLDFAFMTTRGGLSKGQKGLHLNEDIYAGMTAFSRGGRIKHTEYLQCGKGRDMGFCSILNFNTKIGSGMAEQLLSREHYWLGTQLPFDRFLTFFYAHPGFHINNVLILFATYLILISLVCLAALQLTLETCTSSDADDCFHILPIYQWIKATVISIFIVFAVSYLPLFLQVFGEHGFWKTLIRLSKHFLSLSPLFEIFVNKIYAHSLLTNLSFGGARYISTGRGYAITRLPFYQLFTRFADSSLYTGAGFLFLLTFSTGIVWIPHLIYFWLMALALLVCPWLFNPHQFELMEFFLDYWNVWAWFLCGNSTYVHDSWITHTRSIRTRFTGTKRKRLGKALLSDEKAMEHLGENLQRPNKFVIFGSEILFPLLTAILLSFTYTYLASFEKKAKPLIRVLLISILPIFVNAVQLAVVFTIALFVGPILRRLFSKFPTMLAAIVHFSSIIFFSATFLLALALEEFQFYPSVLLLITSLFIHKLILTLITTFLLSREFGTLGQTNLSFWSGIWIGRGMGWDLLILLGREYFIKIVESSYFAIDFYLIHLIFFILSPLLLIPKVDSLHTKMLFWLSSTDSLRKPFFNSKIRAHRRNTVFKSVVLFFFMFLLLSGLMLLPLLLAPKLGFKVKKLLPFNL